MNILDKLAHKWLAMRTSKAVEQNPEFGHFKRAELTPDGFYVEWIDPVVADIADRCARMLTKANAKNYCEFQLFPHLELGLTPISVTIRRVYGKTPAQVNGEIMAAIKELSEYYRTHILNFQYEKMGNFVHALEMFLTEENQT